MFGLGPLEIVVIGALAVMLYGRRLPEVGRSFGRTVGDLRKQWSSLARELDVASHIDGRLPSRGPAARGRIDPGPGLVTSPRFEPPPGVPDSAEAAAPGPAAGSAAATQPLDAGSQPVSGR